MPIRVAIEGGKLTEFNQIFDFMPASKIAVDIKVNYDRIKKLRHHPEELTYKESFLLSEYIEIEYQKISDLVYNQFQNSKDKK